MFKKKKKKIEDTSTESIIPFVIPQISKSPVHIKRKDKKFVMTPAFSAIWGRANIDELVTPPTDPIPYSDRSLDPFRSQDKRKIADDDYKEFESVTIRNADRQKFFPGSRPVGEANTKDKYEEMNSPIKNESRSKRIENEYKRQVVEETPKVDPVYVKDEVDEELLYNDPVYVDVSKPAEVVPPAEDIDDFISNLEIIDEDEFKPAEVEVEQFNEDDYKEEIIEKPAPKVEQPQVKVEVKKEVVEKPKHKKNDYSR